MRVLCLIVLFGAVNSRELSDEEYYQLPQLFQLDDYQKCLSRTEGLYCLGTFHIAPVGAPNAVYDLIKEYSSEPHNFNRSLIHRGYCVSSRCPELNGSHATRFQQCAESINIQLLRTYDPPETKLLQVDQKHVLQSLKTVHTAFQLKERLRVDEGNLLQTTDQLNRSKLIKTGDESGWTQTNLVDFQYCHTSVESQETVSVDVAKLVFLVVMSAVVLLNLVGTAYDVIIQKSKKSQMLTAWSVRKNWRQLTSCPKKSINTPLAALHGIKVGITMCVCLSHSALLHFIIYNYNPRSLEQIVSHPLSMIVQNSTATEQMLFVISGFLLALQLRQRTGKRPMGARVAAFFIAKRIFRLLPVFLLVVGFAATWWPALGGGPLWASVSAESRICRDKFWTHVLFVNNLVEPERLCVLSTWYMAVDFQLHVVSTIILVVLMQFRIPKLQVLVVIFVGSALLNAGLAYAFNWSPMLYLTSSPEKIRTVFRGQPSFPGLYMSPWGNMPAGVLGLIAGHVYTGAGAGDWDVQRLKCLLTPISFLSLPAMLGWIVAGYWLQRVTARPFVVAYAAIERSLFQVCCLLSFVLVCAVDGCMIRFLSWRGWHALSRVSYPVMLVHWLVNLYIVASAPQPITASILDIGVHGFITAFYSFLLATPVTVLVEMPMKKLFDIISRVQESKENFIKIEVSK